MFIDRFEAGQRLARALASLRLESPVVLALPRGGVPVAWEVASMLEAPMDVLIVRKLGAPFQPEFGFGAIGEPGADGEQVVTIIDEHLRQRLGISDVELDRIIATQEAELSRRIQQYRHGRDLPVLRGRQVILVDDGMATGSTARVAVAVLRKLGAERVIVAAPTASTDAIRVLREVADEVITVEQPEDFIAVGEHYQDFTQVTDDEVVRLLHTAVDREVIIPIHADGLRDVLLSGHLFSPSQPRGAVIFAHGSGSSRLSPRNRAVANILHEAGFATLLFDLLTDQEARHRSQVFDVPLLAGRLRAATTWLGTQGSLRHVPFAYFGASTGAAAALVAAVDCSPPIRAIVSRGGRPDLAGLALGRVRCPTLLIVGERDESVLELNQQARDQMHCPVDMTVVPGASHLFEEFGTLDSVASIAARWLRATLATATAAA